MSGETTITVIGNLTGDPELRTTGGGATVVNFTVASTPRSYDRNSGQWVDGQALFLRCSAWRDLGQHVAQSLSKGMRVIVQGRLQQRSYQAQDGSNRTIVEVQVDEVGPSLRYATAQVARTSMSSGFRATYGTPQPQQQQPQSVPSSSSTVEPASDTVQDPWGVDSTEPEF